MPPTLASNRRRPDKIFHEPVATKATKIIRAAIMNGEYALGERLVEAALAECYGISRHVVREALQTLEGEGLVVSDPFCGRSVIKPNQKEIEGLFLARVSLESTATALAAYKLVPEQVRQLEDKAYLSDEEPMEYWQLLEWDIAIHRTIWQIADESPITSCLERLIWPYMIANPIQEVTPEAHHAFFEMQLERERAGHPAGHRQIIQAISEQNPAAAREAMITHLATNDTPKYSKETANAFAVAFPIMKVQE